MRQMEDLVPVAEATAYLKKREIRSHVTVTPVVVIAEGYATAATYSEAFGHGTGSAFDSGHLLSVAEVLHEKYPDKPIIIVGGDALNVGATLGN